LAPGFVAWLLHRLTGLVLAFYILMISTSEPFVPGPAEFDSIMGLVQHRIAKILEIGLLGVVV
jgi:succinate dehydrogenase / fumarate reductase cytochrome b subunit